MHAFKYLQFNQCNWLDSYIANYCRLYCPIEAPHEHPLAAASMTAQNLICAMMTSCLCSADIVETSLTLSINMILCTVGCLFSGIRY